MWESVSCQRKSSGRIIASGAGTAVAESADGGIRELGLKFFEGGFVEVAAEFLEGSAVGDGDIDDAIADFDGFAVFGQVRADRLFPGIAERVCGGAFEQSAGADEVEDRVADGARESGEVIGGDWQGWEP
jgi:hypothetical protein